MGIGDVYSIASDIDSNWILCSISNYTWSFIGVVHSRFRAWFCDWNGCSIFSIEGQAKVQQ